MHYFDLLIKTALVCMFSDGIADPAEIKKMSQFIDADDTTSVEARRKKMIDYADNYKADKDSFLKTYFHELKVEELSVSEQCQIIRCAIEVIQADESIDYSEIVLFKLIRDHLTVSDSDLVKYVPQSTDYLVRDLSKRSITDRVKEYISSISCENLTFSLEDLHNKE